MGDLRNDMMFLLSPSTSLDHLCRQFGLVNVSRDIPGPVGLGDSGPVGLGDSGPAGVAIPGWPVQTCQW